MKTLWSWINTFFGGTKEYRRLREYPLFSELTDYDLYLLSERMHERSFACGEQIFEAGYPLEVIYFIRTGEIKLEGALSGKKDKVLAAKEHLGILDMYHSEERSSTAHAMSDVVVDAISKSDLIDYMRARHSASFKIFTAICSDLARFVFDIAAGKQ